MHEHDRMCAITRCALANFEDDCSASPPLEGFVVNFETARRRLLGMSFAILAALPAAGALAQGAPFDPARAAFEALDEDARKAVQDALVWTGDYKGMIDGVYGRGARDAIAAYGARMNLRDGLDERARVALLAQTKALKSSVGFTKVDDARSGAQFALPLKILTRRSDAGSGSRWSNAANSVALQSFRLEGPEADLPRLYDSLRAIPGRQIAYRVLRANFLVISGEDARGVFYTRAGLSDDPAHPLVRGYTLVYARALRPALEPMAIAISNGFEPFPSRALAPLEATTQLAPAPPPEERTTVQASAIAVGPGLALSVLPRACTAPRIGGRAVKIIARDAASGLALLAADGLKGRALAPAQATAQDGAAIVALFATNGAETATVAVAPGEIAPKGRVAAALQDGGAGAAVFTRAGGWVGVAGRPGMAVRRIAGLAPHASWPMIAGADVAAFLVRSGVKPAASAIAEEQGERSAGEIAAVAAASIAGVTCGF